MQGECIKPYRLARIIPGFRSEKLESKAKRIRELLDGSALTDFVAYAKYIFKLFGIETATLAIDRTNWQHGETDINFLILSLVWEGISIPIYWIHLNNKGGNSDSIDRINLIKWFTEHFGAERIEVILADREFPSQEFYEWLKLNNIDGLFRSRENINASNGDKKALFSRIYKDLKLGAQKIERLIRRVYGKRLYVAVKRIKSTDKKKDTELVILVSTKEFTDDPFLKYRERWTIEIMFNKFKGPGFNLEETSVINYKRLSSLLMLLCIAYCFSCYAGKIRKKIVAIKSKSKSCTWHEYSLFRYGLDLIKHTLFVQQDEHLRDRLWTVLSGGRVKAGSKLFMLIKSI